MRLRTIARLVTLIAIAVAAAVAQSACVAATIAVDSERHGDAIDIRASVLLAADPGTAWRVLTDYNGYAEFIPDLRRSRVVARHGSTVTVEQSGEAEFWPFRLPLDITFEIDEFPPGRLHSRAVAGSLRALTSNYALTPAKSGTRLDYVGRIEPGFTLFGNMEQAAVERNVARQFQALADEIGRQAMTARSSSTAGVK